MQWYIFVLMASPGIVLFLVLWRVVGHKNRLLFDALERSRDKVAALERSLAELERRLPPLSRSLDDTREQSRQREAQWSQQWAEISARLDLVQARQEKAERQLSHLPLGGGKSKPRQKIPALDSGAMKDVLSLLDAGHSAEEIARRKGMQVGEIELIKGLRSFGTKDGKPA
jgi:hypothetical protein